ncbi:MAG: hypothetical protein C0399_06860 [Syntrophus sp. (in: bacteria)]|nr:hypothetical protein [Syntrophus sp. (in: bacteria)]
MEKDSRSLIYKGQGRPRGISPDMKKEIIFDFSNVQRICNAISETRSWGDIAGRNDLIRSSFPDVGTKIITENIITNANQLRNLVLSERCGCSALNVEDFVRAEYSIFEYLTKYPDVESIDEDRQRIIITLKHGKRTIINK